MTSKQEEKQEVKVWNTLFFSAVAQSDQPLLEKVDLSLHAVVQPLFIEPALSSERSVTHLRLRPNLSVPPQPWTLPDSPGRHLGVWECGHGDWASDSPAGIMCHVMCGPSAGGCVCLAWDSWLHPPPTENHVKETWTSGGKYWNAEVQYFRIGQMYLEDHVGTLLQ